MPRFSCAREEDAALAQSRLELRHRAAARAEPRRRRLVQGDAGPGEPVGLGLARERRREHGARRVEDDGGLDLRGDLGQVGEGGRDIHEPDDTPGVYRPFAQPLAKFFADRGPHLAAMIAYFGLLSSVSLIFLALALLGFTGRAEESSYFVEALRPPLSLAVDRGHRQGRRGDHARTRPRSASSAARSCSGRRSRSSACSSRRSTSSTTGRTARSCAASSWRRCSWPARSSSLSIGLVIGGVRLRPAPALRRRLRRATASSPTPSRRSSRRSPSSSSSSLAYERLTNATLTLREVWPGAALAAVLLQATFQVLPLFVRLSREVVAVQALGTSALLLVWIYVMANVIVFGAEVNWWYGAPRRGRDRRPGLVTGCY